MKRNFRLTFQSLGGSKTSFIVAPEESLKAMNMLNANSVVRFVDVKGVEHAILVSHIFMVQASPLRLH